MRIKCLAIKYLGFVLFYISSLVVSAQQSRGDSLLVLISNTTEDTNRVRNLVSYSIFCNGDGQLNRANKYADEAYLLSQKLNYQRGLMMALRVKGTVYTLLGNYSSALEWDFKLLEKAKSFGDRRDQCIALNSIGVTFWYQGNFNKALEYYLKAFEMCKSTNDSILSPGLLNNIGLIYRIQGNYGKAIKYYQQSSILAEKTNNVRTLADCLNNMGIVYETLNDRGKALQYCFKALKIREQINDKLGLATSFGNLGTIYFAMKEEKKAIEYFKKSMAVSTEINDLEGIKEANSSLSDMYLKIGDGITALKYYKEFIRLRDSLNNNEVQKESMRHEMEHQFETEKITLEKEQEKKDIISADERKVHRLIIFSVSTGLILLFLFFLFLFNRFRLIKRQKLVIENQKVLVEIKQRQVMDSINYAKRIQTSILVSQEEIKTHLPDLFILYEPKDIVSGDFYWFSSVNSNSASKVNENEQLIVVADCTGHGVPGAFLSMVGSTLLNEIVNHNEKTDPAEIIVDLASGVTTTLINKEKEESSTDGMDISICKINRDKKTVQFAGANQSIYLLDKSGLKIIEPQINSINGIFGIESDKELHTIKIEVEHGTMVYMMTDGYVDQIGEKIRKKFLHSRLEKLLLNNYLQSVEEQRAVLEESLKEWKGSAKQTDDILVIGFKM